MAGEAACTGTRARRGHDDSIPGALAPLQSSAACTHGLVGRGSGRLWQGHRWHPRPRRPRPPTLLPGVPCQSSCAAYCWRCPGVHFCIIALKSLKRTPWTRCARQARRLAGTRSHERSRRSKECAPRLSRPRARWRLISGLLPPRGVRRPPCRGQEAAEQAQAQGQGQRCAAGAAEGGARAMGRHLLAEGAAWGVRRQALPHITRGSPCGAQRQEVGQPCLALLPHRRRSRSLRARTTATMRTRAQMGTRWAGTTR